MEAQIKGSSTAASSGDRGDLVTHTRFATGGSIQIQQDGRRDVVIFTNADTTTVPHAPA